MNDDEQIAAMQALVDGWGGPPETTLIIELDRYPGEPLAYDGDVEGRRADEAAARWENDAVNQAGWAS